MKQAPDRALAHFFRLASLFSVLALLAVSFPSETTAQGFSVSPIRVEADVPSGRTIDIPFELSNSTDVNTFEMSIRHVDLLQNSNGSWRFENTEEVFDPERHQSNRDWFTNSEQTVTVGPQQSQEIILNANVPRGVRGTSLSALLVTSDAQGEEDDAVRLRFQFLVPIILTISGRPARQDIDLGGVDMRLLPPVNIGGDGSPRAVAYLNVTNNGETYSRVTGDVRIEKNEAGNWRLVTTQPIDERGIIPGSDLFLEAPLGRSLPSGDYRLTGNLTVDGRRLPRVAGEIALEGDPELDAIAFDTSILIDPEIVEVAVRPGASRAQAIKLTNPSDATVDVLLTPEVPTELENVAIGTMMGTELSAANWVETAPAKVTMRPNSSRNVRLVARLPEDAPVHPYYYSNILVESFYPDGQNAGVSRGQVVLDRNGAAASPNVILERLSYAATNDEGEHVLSARVVNAGNMHAQLQASAALIFQEDNSIIPVEMEGREGLMLPFSVWDFAGTFDLNQLPEGAYILRANFDYAGNNRATQDLNVVVTTNEDGQKTLSTPEE